MNTLCSLALKTIPIGTGQHQHHVTGAGRKRVCVWYVSYKPTDLILSMIIIFRLCILSRVILFVLD